MADEEILQFLDRLSHRSKRISCYANTRTARPHDIRQRAEPSPAILTDEERARRKRHNLQRVKYRTIAKEFRENPPVVGLGRREYLKLFGEGADYDAYCEAFMAAARKAHRRHEFPLEALGGVCL